MDNKAGKRELSRGQQIGGFVIESILATSEFSVSYKAVDPDSKPVVLKELNPVSLVDRNELGQLIPNSSASAEIFEKANRHFLAVGTLLSEIQNRSLVNVQEVVSSNNTSYLVMHYEDGFSLKEVLAQTAVLEYEDIKNIIFPLLNGLKTLHSKKILHLSITIDNVLIRKDGTPLLIGMNALYERDLSPDLPATAIDPDYAPIEQFSSDKTLVGEFSDIYSLAAVLYQCMSGQTPAKSNKRYHAVRRSEADPYESISKAAQGNFTVRMMDAVDHALVLNPADRPKSVDDWSQEFLTLTDDGDVTVMKETNDIVAGIEETPVRDELSDLIENRRKLFRAAVSGKNQTYYMSVLIQQDIRGFLPALRWNFAAFLFSLIWVFYRKMYLFGIVVLPLISIPVAFGIYKLSEYYLTFEKYYFISPTVDFTAAAHVLFHALFFGVFGNYIYYLHIRRKISQSQKKFPDIKNQRKWLSKKGGVSIVAACLVTIFLVADTYSSYQKLIIYKAIAREQTNEAVLLLNELGGKVADFRRQKNRWPGNIQELANPPGVQGYQFVAQVKVVNQLIAVTFVKNRRFLYLSGKSMAYVGYESDGEIFWVCGSIDVPLEFMPPACKKKLK